MVLDEPAAGGAEGREVGVHRVDGRGEPVVHRLHASVEVEGPPIPVGILERPPSLGATPKSIDDSAALAVRGVLTVVPISVGVAVVAKNTHAARKGREALVIEWQGGPSPSLDTERLRTTYRELSQSPGPLVARNDGDAGAAMHAGGGKHLEALYELPFLAHATMEPLNCTAHWRKDRCDVWTGTQMQSPDQAAAAEVAGLPAGQIFIHTTLLGGGFGRRANPGSDFVREAVELSRKLAKPVQVVWTREDDMHGGWYRPQWADRIRATLDHGGKPQAWHHTIVGQSMAGTMFEPMMVKDGIDPTSVEGAAELPYRIANLRVDLHTTTAPVRVQWWRSVGHTHTAFAARTRLVLVGAMAAASPAGRPQPHSRRRPAAAGRRLPRRRRRRRSRPDRRRRRSRRRPAPSRSRRFLRRC